ncbi:hypothetical protein MMC06_005379, partial [Schaereria dolodes]|nr:hypothetical protein [Schaereria dolodes]
AAQSSLLQQRNLIKQLNDRLYELGQQDDGTYSDSSMEEDILAEYISPSRTQGPAPSDPSSPTLDRRKQSEVSLTSQSVLRNRNDANPSRPATTTAHTLHSSLQSATTQSNPEPSSTQILEASSTTQADLTSSLLTLAAALKASSLSFQSSLDAEKALLESTSSSLDKNADGMQAAEKRMGMLRRMSEGKGWLGRMMLYAWIGGLWVVAILLVFVGPKLRF